jgi:hypothetical protein
MNISTLSNLTALIVPLEVQLRDLDVVRAICRRHGWEFRAEQRTYRWFGWWLGAGPPPAGLGRCDHAIGVPGCAYEIGLVARGEHFAPVWDSDPAGGLTAALGPGGRLLWQSYVVEKVRRAAPAQGHTVSRHTDSHSILRVRIAEPTSQRSAHVRLTADGNTTLWLFGPGARETFAYLIAALGRIRTDGETAHDPAAQ